MNNENEDPQEPIPAPTFGACSSPASASTAKKQDEYESPRTSDARAGECPVCLSEQRLWGGAFECSHSICSDCNHSLLVASCSSECSAYRCPLCRAEAVPEAAAPFWVRQHLHSPAVVEARAAVIEGRLTAAERVHALMRLVEGDAGWDRIAQAMHRASSVVVEVGEEGEEGADGMLAGLLAEVEEAGEAELAAELEAGFAGNEAQVEVRGRRLSGFMAQVAHALFSNADGEDVDSTPNGADPPMRNLVQEAFGPPDHYPRGPDHHQPRSFPGEASPLLFPERTFFAETDFSLHDAAFEDAGHDPASHDTWDPTA